MCGIAGIVGGTHPEESAFAVKLMTRALERRGPDAEGVEVWPRAVLGHRRLAILDLSDAGRQPMLSPDRNVGVVFNGAIYNHLELRASLEQHGYVFSSRTDTEVLVHGYCEWGIDGLAKRLRGMFAFGVWDARVRKLFLVRDRLGVKPLLYASRGDTLAFASSVRALRKGGFADQIDDGAVTDFLHFGYIKEQLTIYRGVHKLAPASILEWNSGNIQVTPYWSAPVVATGRPIAFEEAIETTEHLLLSAVKARLHADVKVATLLSGGIDSGLVAWAASQLGADLTAFTVAVSGDPSDESSDAAHTARELGLPHAKFEVAATSLGSVTELVSAYAEPFACPSALGMLAISRAVRGSATVLLTGDGGDDVFLGYPDFVRLLRAQQVARCLPGIFARVWPRLRLAASKTELIRRVSHFLDFAVGGIAAVAHANSGIGLLRANGILGDRLQVLPDPERDLSWSSASAKRLVQDFQEYHCRGRFVSEFMTKVDGATMFYGLEARSPLLDQGLWEYASSLPLDVRLHRATPKAVLRELARRRLGHRIAAGRKRGFTIPVEHWIATRWFQEVDDCFRSSILAGEGWVHLPRLLAYLQTFRNRGPVPLQIWGLYVLEHWLRHERGSHLEQR